MRRLDTMRSYHSRPSRRSASIPLLLTSTSWPSARKLETIRSRAPASSSTTRMRPEVVLTFDRRLMALGDDVVALGMHSVHRRCHGFSPVLTRGYRTYPRRGCLWGDGVWGRNYMRALTGDTRPLTPALSPGGRGGGVDCGDGRHR